MAMTVNRKNSHSVGSCVVILEAPFSNDTLLEKVVS